jgi:hypothetical protein
MLFWHMYCYIERERERERGERGERGRGRRERERNPRTYWPASKSVDKLIHDFLENY